MNVHYLIWKIIKTRKNTLWAKWKSSVIFQHSVHIDITVVKRDNIGLLLF